ncbi:MAG: GNAT family N-acetyltransferase [Dehalococcoidia bacterium]|nr:GNAT family N-acetyltransferase [Dehalococcoidia bacterium]
MSNPFGEHVDVPVERYDTGETYRMVSIDAGYAASDEDVDSIVTICNEPLVYRFLFRDRLDGRAYNERDARDFVAWARDGWLSGEHLVFLIRAPDDAIAACIDVGAVDGSGRGLSGYWSCDLHRGVVTNAMERLAVLAKDAGYRTLYTFVEEENLRSLAVFKRTGFTHVGFHDYALTFLDRPVGKVVRLRRYERAL